MKRSNWTLLLLVLLALVLIVAGCAAGDNGANNNNNNDEQTQNDNQNQDPNQAQGVPEEQVAKMTTDQAPNGCGDCHKKQDEEHDYSLSAEAAGIEGHPELKEDAGVEDCVVCHKESGPAPELGGILHVAHLVEGDHYQESYDHNCINCHKISDEGSVAVKGLENGES